MTASKLIISLFSLSITCSVAMTPAEQREIVDIHNALRRGEGSSNMRILTWDQQLAIAAQNSSNSCQYGVNGSSIIGDRIPGQNVFMSISPINLTDAVVLWYEQKVDYDFDNNSCAIGKYCEGYVQVVWANSYEIGCAYTECPSFDFAENVTNSTVTVLVCYYNPLGNYINQSPYQKGIPCSQCTNGTSYCCYKGLCDLEPTQQPPILDACLIGIVQKLELFKSPYKESVEGTYSIGDSFIYLGQYQWVEGGPWMIFVAVLPDRKPTGWVNTRHVATDSSATSCSKMITLSSFADSSSTPTAKSSAVEHSTLATDTMASDVSAELFTTLRTSDFFTEALFDVTTHTRPVTDSSSALTAKSSTVEYNTITTETKALDISTEFFTILRTSDLFTPTLIDATTHTRQVTDTSSAAERTSATDNYSTTVTESVRPSISAGVSSMQMTQQVTTADAFITLTAAVATAVRTAEDSSTSTTAPTEGELTQQPPILDACLIGIVQKLELFKSPYKESVEGTYSIGDSFIYLGQYQWVEGGPWMIFVAVLPDRKPTGWVNARHVATDSSATSCSKMITLSSFADSSSTPTAKSSAVEHSTLATDTMASDVSAELFTTLRTSDFFTEALFDVTTHTRPVTDTSSAAERTSATDNSYSTIVTESVRPSISAGIPSVPSTKSKTVDYSTIAADSVALDISTEVSTTPMASSSLYVSSLDFSTYVISVTGFSDVADHSPIKTTSVSADLRTQMSQSQMASHSFAATSMGVSPPTTLISARSAPTVTDTVGQSTVATNSVATGTSIEMVSSQLTSHQFPVSLAGASTNTVPVTHNPSYNPSSAGTELSNTAEQNTVVSNPVTEGLSTELLTTQVITDQFPSASIEGTAHTIPVLHSSSESVASSNTMKHISVVIESLTPESSTGLFTTQSTAEQSPISSIEVSLNTLPVTHSPTSMEISDTVEYITLVSSSVTQGLLTGLFTSQMTFNKLSSTSIDASTNPLFVTDSSATVTRFSETVEHRTDVSDSSAPGLSPGVFTSKMTSGPFYATSFDDSTDTTSGTDISSPESSVSTTEEQSTVVSDSVAADISTGLFTSQLTSNQHPATLTKALTNAITLMNTSPSAVISITDTTQHSTIITDISTSMPQTSIDASPSEIPITNTPASAVIRISDTVDFSTLVSNSVVLDISTGMSSSEESKEVPTTVVYSTTMAANNITDGGSTDKSFSTVGLTNGVPTQQPPKFGACLIAIVDRLKLFRRPFKKAVKRKYPIGTTFIYLGQYKWVQGGPWMLFVAALPNRRPTGWVNAREVATDISSASC